MPRSVIAELCDKYVVTILKLCQTVSQGKSTIYIPISNVREIQLFRILATVSYDHYFFSL